MPKERAYEVVVSCDYAFHSTTGKVRVPNKFDLKRAANITNDFIRNHYDALVWDQKLTKKEYNRYFTKDQFNPGNLDVTVKKDGDAYKVVIHCTDAFGPSGAVRLPTRSDNIRIVNIVNDLFDKHYDEIKELRDVKNLSKKKKSRYYTKDGFYPGNLIVKLISIK